MISVGEMTEHAAKVELQRALNEIDRLHDVIKNAVAAEREGCARVCEELVLSHPGRADLTADQCAAAIRGRK